MATSPAELTSKIVALLEKAESQDRRRIISAALVLLGDEQTQMPDVDSRSDQLKPASGAPADGTARARNVSEFFNAKDPHSKIEELAVAARFRELVLRAQSHSKGDLEAVFRDARRNFDSHNFQRDTINAKTKGFFNKGGERGQLTLAYYGQQFVDALPDRDAVKKLRRPKGTRRKLAKKNTTK